MALLFVIIMTELLRAISVPSHCVNEAFLPIFRIKLPESF